MSKSIINVGVDIGNSDSKTPHSTTYSGFTETTAIPYGAAEALIYKGVVYVPDIERFPYVKDKTRDNKCLILTLFGIAKEIIASLSGTYDSAEKLQENINFVEGVNLGVGLPPAHMTLLRERLESYYRESFGEGIEFQLYYKAKGTGKAETYNFNLKLYKLGVYPQDLAATFVAAGLAKNNPKDPSYLTNKYKKSGYYAIDIGGYTVDVVQIIDNVPQSSKCASEEVGILKMYAHIEDVINMEYGLTLTDNHIENILKDEPVAINANVISKVKALSAEWMDRIINELRKKGIEFGATPVIFLGGGSALLEDSIKANNIISNCEYTILSNPKANSIGYQNIIGQAS